MDGRIIDIYGVCYPTGSAKFSVWEECAGKLDVGSVYDLEGVRVQHDLWTHRTGHSKARIQNHQNITAH